MADILRHPHFGRPPVANPNKRRRKGTADIRVARRRRDNRRTVADDARPRFLDQPLGKGNWVDIKADGDIGAVRLLRALQSEGLTLAGGAIIDWPLDPEDIRITDQIRKIINDLTAEELIEVLEAIKAIKARRTGAAREEVLP